MEDAGEYQAVDIEKQEMIAAKYNLQAYSGLYFIYRIISISALVSARDSHIKPEGIA